MHTKYNNKIFHPKRQHLNVLVYHVDMVISFPISEWWSGRIYYCRIYGHFSLFVILWAWLFLLSQKRYWTEQCILFPEYIIFLGSFFKKLVSHLLPSNIPMLNVLINSWWTPSSTPFSLLAWQKKSYLICASCMWKCQCYVGFRIALSV